MRDLVLILGDQLSPSLSSLRRTDKSRARLLMAEVMEEASYVPHHKKKLAFTFSAMRHHGAALKKAGWQLTYRKLKETGKEGSLAREVARAVKEYRPQRLLVTEPGEYRLKKEMESWAERFSLPVEICPDTRFIASHEEFSQWAAGRKELRMEYFYREMRRKTGLLMEGGEPCGGKWNFDTENRKSLPKGQRFARPQRTAPDKTTRDVLKLVEKRFAANMGSLSDFWFAVTREEAETARNHFLKTALPLFGDYQDAMAREERFLAHSVLSIYMNAGLLDPLETAKAAEAEYKAGRVPLNAAEGFIRQIIGWREYVRGIYWQRMPGYIEANALGAERPLPEFYWTGDTQLACLKAAVGQTIEEAYAHHIQRLMLTGTFALLAGVRPQELHEWYLAVYADAYEWVEAPNTLGMSQYADGGLLGSKPYAASGAYINRMSDYCKACAYKVKEKTGAQACPFNYLYWDFIARHEARLKSNPRMGPIYRNWARIEADKKKAIRASARAFLEKLA